jgi:hypothetical protein
MAVTARASSNGRSPGAARIPSTRVPSRARRTIPFSFSAHSPRSASAAWAASMAALASKPAHETTSCRSAAVSAIASEQAALRRHRAGALCRSRRETPVAAARPPGPPPGRARRPAHSWPSRPDSPAPGRPRTCRPAPRRANAGRRRGRRKQIDPLTLHRKPGAAVREPPPRPRLDHGALEAERAHVVGPNDIAVVEAENASRCPPERGHKRGGRRASLPPRRGRRSAV